ncbi:hypothetical protein MCEMSEM23_00681 [Rhabdaerophilaceae bacterium]
MIQIYQVKEACAKRCILFGPPRLFIHDHMRAHP